MNTTEHSSRFTERNQSEAWRAMGGCGAVLLGGPEGAIDVRTSKGWSGHGEPKGAPPRA